MHHLDCSVNWSFLSVNAQAEMAGKRIGKVLDINKENENLMEEYERLASQVSAKATTLTAYMYSYRAMNGKRCLIHAL